MPQKMTESKIPFQKMTFAPDVPSSALGPNEYNTGINVETDVRGIRSVAGDEEILDSVPGTPTFVSGGYRADGYFWFIVATDEGYWWASKGDAWQDITPPGGPYVGYNQAINITECWNGTVPFFNDTVNPPIFWLDGNATMSIYSNELPLSISNIAYDSPTTLIITLSTAQASAPYSAGEKIVISGVDNYYNGTYVVASSTTTTITYYSTVSAGYPGGGSVAPQYAWNYNPNWKSVTATFMRLYSTPNVGSILVAGGLTAVNLDDSVSTYPVTVQWSQAFGLNQAPQTWEPTITNVANQLEVPLRGPAIDAFPSNGQLFLCSYWDTVVFSPINYSTTSAPILGVRLYNQGRGLLSSNCWANADQQVYGIDARDIWVFDGSNFTGIGNQRVKNWFYDQLDQRYVDRVFIEINTQKNQVEIYYPTTEAVNGVPNRMLSYRYDLDIWNAPREVDSATMGCESPIWSGNVANYGSRTIVYARGATDKKLIQKDQGFSWADGGEITSLFRRDNIKLLNDYSGKLLVHRILPEAVNLDGHGVEINPGTGNVSVTILGAQSVGGTRTITNSVDMPISTDYPWTQFTQNSYRVNTIELGNTSNTSIWMCNSITWQYAQTEDDR
jgi:hypothetical protein